VIYDSSANKWVQLCKPIPTEQNKAERFYRQSTYEELDSSDLNTI
jgi:hypothetical protein